MIIVLFLADTVSGKFICNGQPVKIDINQFCEKLLSIVCFWEENLILPNVHDAEKYKIVIEKDGQVLKLAGCGKYPSNYADFKKLLKEVLV